MDKLIQSQSTQETVKICYGNDFTLTVSVNEWNDETGTWDKLDLSASSDIELFLVAQNGKRIKTTSSLDNEGNITADIPATYLSKTVYALEITFKQDNRNRRTYSPCLIQIVNSTDEAGKSVIDYTTNDAYHFDILVKNDIAWLNIGTLPSEYITQAELDEVLTSYVTNATLDSMSYVTQSSLDSMSYVTQSSLDSMSYVTNAALETMSYVDSSTLDTTLESYVTGDALESKLTAYVTGGSYDSDLHMINLYHDNTVVSSIDASAFIIDGMIENVYISNGYLVIEFNTDAGKQDIEIPLTSIFDPSNYYNKSDIDTTLSAYVTNAALETMAYVTADELDAMSYVTNAALETMAYVTHDYLDNAAYITINDIPAQTGEVTYAWLDQCAYVTQTSLDSQSYVTNAALETMAYVSHDYLDQQSYITLNDIPAIAGEVTYAFLDEQSYVQCYTSSYIYELTQSEFNTLKQNDELEESYLYYITDAAPSGGEVTYAWLDQCAYVSHDYLDQQSYATINDIPTVPTDLSQLNNDMGFIDSTAITGMVTSLDITTIEQISQNDYNTLVNNSQVDPNTLYIIV